MNHPDRRRVAADDVLALSPAAHAPAGPALSLAHDGDDDLLRRIARGDRTDAVAELYARHSRGLYALARRMLRDPGAAEEVVQETFLRAWRGAAAFDHGRGSVRGWLYTIARNASLDAARKRTPQPEDQSEEIAAKGDDFEDVLVSLTVREALDALSPAHREVLNLAFDADMTRARAAERLGLSVGTVKSRTFYALAALRTELTKRGIDA